MFRKFIVKNNTISNLSFTGYLNSFNESFKKKIDSVTYTLFKKWDMPLLILGFLLGRATILDGLSPFAIPFFAVMYHFKKDKILLFAIAILFGTNMANYQHPTIIFFGILTFFLLQKLLDRRNKVELSYIPFQVLLAVLIPQFTLHIINQNDQFYPWMMSMIEALLGFVITLIFVQAIPIIMYKREQVSLSQEEIIALTIVIASAMTGTLGWEVNGLAVEVVFSRYFILVFAFVGGGPIGAAVGVITGLILSLADPNVIYQISLLAFSGLLAGLLKQGNKIGVGIGLLLGTSILSIYIGGDDGIFKALSESSVAILFFFLTPKSLLKEVAKYIPGTNEYHSQYQDYVEKVRTLTSKKIDQFAIMFDQLAKSFKEITSPVINDQNEQIDHFMNKVSEIHCSTCWKKHRCWNDEFFQTYRLMTELMTVIEASDEITKKTIPKDWVEHCIKHEQTAFELADIYDGYGDHLYWKSQLEESRLLVAHQLFGVSKVMKDLASEITKEGKELSTQEQQIQNSLEKLGLSVMQVNIFNLDEGNVEIEITQPFCNGTDECLKVVAPLLSEVIGENIVVKNKNCHFNNDGLCRMFLQSAKTYEVETGYASAAKGGKWLSGDSFSTIEIGKGKYGVALSDGMGNGERAQQESKATLELLQQLLHSGIDETISIKTINSVLLLRSQEEIFSTIDLAIVDLFNGHTKFLKVGSTPSFIKRDKEVIIVSSNNLPIGIIQDIDIESIEFNLLPGDILIMVTDGIYDTPKHANNKEIWMKRLIQEIETIDPQEFADLLLEKAVRYGQGEILDDMTVVISKIERYQPEWASIKVPGLQKVERDKMVN